VATVPVTLSQPDEGATGPSLLGTGDGTMNFNPAGGHAGSPKFIERVPPVYIHNLGGNPFQKP